MLRKGSLPLLIKKEEEVDDPIKEKRGGLLNNRSKTNQNSTVKYLQIVGKETNKWSGFLKDRTRRFHKLKKYKIRQVYL